MVDPIYLDYAATTPIDPAVVDDMLKYMGPKGVFGNSDSRTHTQGQEALRAIENAREQVADLLCAKPDEIILTSGATESINLTIKGVANCRKDKGLHIITSSLEHSAVLSACSYLGQNGYEVTILQPDQDGKITPSCVEAALRSDTILVSLMHVK